MRSGGSTWAGLRGQPKAHDEWFTKTLTSVLRQRRDGRPEIPGSRRLARARDFICAHSSTGVSLAEAAREAGLSPQHFAASFRARYGLPPHRFQTLMRLDEARRLLAAGMPAVDVAAQCGFSDQSHFDPTLQAISRFGAQLLRRGRLALADASTTIDTQQARLTPGRDTRETLQLRCLAALDDLGGRVLQLVRNGF